MRYKLRIFSVFTAQCTLMQSAVLRSHVVHLFVCVSVPPSVTLVDCDHIGWKSWKLIARTISPTSSLFLSTPRETWENFGETRRGLGKKWHASWRTKATMSLKRVKTEEKLWMAYRNSPTLFQTVPSPTPYGLPFPKIGGTPTQKCNLQFWVNKCC